MLFIYFSALPVLVGAQAFIFHSQAKGEALEGTSVSLAKLAFGVEGRTMTKLVI